MCDTNKKKIRRAMNRENNNQKKAKKIEAHRAQSAPNGRMNYYLRFECI